MFKTLYGIRSTLVHDGEVPDHDFVQSAEAAKAMLRTIVDSLLAPYVPPMPEEILTGQGPPLPRVPALQT